MSKCTERNLNFIKNIYKCKGDKRKKLISTATKDNIDSISEIALNTLKGNVPIQLNSLKKLKRHANSVRKISRKGVSVKERKRVLQQEGGFLPLILAPFLSAAGTLVGRALAKNFGI